jgi:hypothetical protein
LAARGVHSPPLLLGDNCTAAVLTWTFHNITKQHATAVSVRAPPSNTCTATRRPCNIAIPMSQQTIFCFSFSHHSIQALPDTGHTRHNTCDVSVLQNNIYTHKFQQENSVPQLSLLHANGPHSTHLTAQDMHISEPGKHQQWPMPLTAVDRHCMSCLMW